MFIVGIDPGFKGAIGFVSVEGLRHRAIPMPVVKESNKNVLDEYAIKQIFDARKKKIKHVFVEKAQAMPGQGVTSMFNYAAGYGFLRGLLVGLDLPYTLVRPTSWKREICRDMPKGKDVSIIVVKRLWPGICLKPTRRSKKDSDGMADALCIAEYGRRALRD